MQAKPYRILYVEKPVSIGGSVIGLYQLVRGLDKSRYEPIVLFYGPNPYRERFQELGVRVFVLDETLHAYEATPSRRDIAASLGRFSGSLADAYRLAKQVYLMVRQDWPMARRIRHLIASESIALVHHNNSLSGNRPAIIAARWAGVPQVCHVRFLNGFSPVGRYVGRSVAAFIYMSTAIERVYCELGISPEKGHIVYDGFDAKLFGQNGRDAALRAEFGLSDQDWMISNVGRLDWWKGQDYFLQALAEIVPWQPNGKALLIGAPDSTSSGQAYHRRLERMVADLRLSDHIVFTGFRPDVPELMAASDIVVHSSSEPEPFGRVVVEAMLAGRPVVATAAGGVLDIVEDQVTGLLVPPRDASAMARAIQQLLQNREQAKSMGQRAQQQAKERFSVEQHVKAIQQIYENILATGNYDVQKG